MGFLHEIISSPEKQLTNEDFQTVLLAAQKSHHHKEEAESWDKLLTILWRHLSAKFDSLDDQLLCSTCFYAVLQLCENQQESFTKILAILEDKQLKDHDAAQVISLIYGMFQSSFFASISKQYDPILDSIVIKSLEILLLMGYEYSRFTFITFKILGRLKQLLNSPLKKHVLDRNIQLQFLNLCNHNWENPFTGVRDMNRTIFRIFLSALDTTTFNIILKDLNGYTNDEDNWCEGHYWNKAKYLMLTELIEEKVTATNLVELKYSSWIDGVIYSLRKPGLVSAGADMYFAILKKINGTQWRHIFTEPLLTALEMESEKFVENFGNYWCLTTLKKLPELFDYLMSVSRNYCKYFILKQGNKLGLIKTDWQAEHPLVILIKNGLDSADVYIRLLCFDVLCLSYNSAPPVQAECKLVLDFIENNINTDSTVLRINMIMSLKSFLNRLHGSFLSYHKTKDYNSVEPLVKFCEEIQQIVIDSLNTPGNYQRKITSLKLCDVIFTHFSELPRKKHTWNKSTILIKVLNERGTWKFVSHEFVDKLIHLLKDPSDDIRENVNKILLNHYFDCLKETKVYNSVIRSALESIESKFFYEISCGISTFKLLINLLLKEDQVDTQFNTVEDIFMFAFDNFKSVHNSGQNIVKTIESGKQLHSFVTIMSIVIEYSLKNNGQLIFLKPELIDDILIILETQSMNFASQNDDCVNSDFCMIDGIIRDTILESGHKEIEKADDKIKISDLSQIVLNCMWLNVKESCVLASVLIRYLSQDEQESSCRRCLNILTNVLETSRHKGAMEAAGGALGQAIQHLTSLPQGALTSLPKALLEVKLEELISNTMRTASVTRRGAGLSILVHKIVASDSMRGRPLFHYFMRKLLSTGDTVSKPSSRQEGPARDLPKAIQLHFLTRIVTDRGLACGVMHYSAHLAQLAFVNLTSPHWQIRNAALQLYGALIPKLIGQNKQSGTEETTVATVAIDEFRTHFPQLWGYILHRINPHDVQDTVRAHSELVPILNLLANCAKRYHFSFDTTNELTNPQVFQNLAKLLSSPIATVRRLTAKCIYNNYSFVYINKNLLRREIMSENEFHGRLQVYEMLHKNYSHIYSNDFDSLRYYYSKIFRAKRHSHLCKVILEKVCYLSVYEDFDTAYEELMSNYLSPGVHYWMDTRVAQCFTNEFEDDLPELIMKIIQLNVIDRYLQVIQKSIAFVKVGKGTKIKICDLILKYAIERKCGVAWNFVYDLSSAVDITLPVEFDMNRDGYNNVTYASRYALPVIVKGLIAAKKIEELVQLGIKILELSDFDTVDSDMRYAAMLANNLLGLVLPAKLLPDHATARVILCAVIFLQEEDEVIRYEAINFYNNVTTQELKLNPYICLKNILQRIFLSNLFIKANDGILALCDEVDRIVEKYTCESQSSDVDYNPFSITINNIYIELDYLSDLASNLRLEA